MTVKFPINKISFLRDAFRILSKAFAGNLPLADLSKVREIVYNCIRSLSIYMISQPASFVLKCFILEFALPISQPIDPVPAIIPLLKVDHLPLTIWLPIHNLSSVGPYLWNNNSPIAVLAIFRF